MTVKKRDTKAGQETQGIQQNYARKVEYEANGKTVKMVKDGTRCK